MSDEFSVKFNSPQNGVLDMEDHEAIQMMQRCVHELRQLRKDRDALRAKAEAWDILSTVVGLIPGRGISMDEDLAWRLEKHIEELQPKPARPTDEGSVLTSFGRPWRQKPPQAPAPVEHDTFGDVLAPTVPPEQT